jgi:hypothetical protein
MPGPAADHGEACQAATDRSSRQHNPAGADAETLAKGAPAGPRRCHGRAVSDVRRGFEAAAIAVPVPRGWQAWVSNARRAASLWRPGFSGPDPNAIGSREVNGFVGRP